MMRTMEDEWFMLFAVGVVFRVRIGVHKEVTLLGAILCGILYQFHQLSHSDVNSSFTWFGRVRMVMGF